MTAHGTVSAQRGQAIVWIAVFLPFFLSVVGLAIDGGIVFDARRALQDVADGAARAGAMQIDPIAFRTRGTVVLDQVSARQEAAAYVADQDPRLAPAIDVSATEVVVTVRERVPTSFLRIVGLRSVQISATATGEAQHGIARARP